MTQLLLNPVQLADEVLGLNPLIDALTLPVYKPATSLAVPQSTAVSGTLVPRAFPAPEQASNGQSAYVNRLKALTHPVVSRLRSRQRRAIVEPQQTQANKTQNGRQSTRTDQSRTKTFSRAKRFFD